MIKDSELQKLRADFKAFYQENLATKYTQTRIKRIKSYKKEIIITQLILFICVLISYFFIEFIAYTHGITPKGIAVGIFVYLLLSVIMFVSSYSYLIKEKVDLKPILAFFKDFHPEELQTPINEKTETPIATIYYLKKLINHSHLFDYKCTERSVDDSISGTYKETEIYISEDELSYREEDATAKSLGTISYNFFKGILIFIKTEKTFKLPVVVRYSLFKFDIQRLKSILFATFITILALILFAILFAVAIYFISEKAPTDGFGDMLEILLALLATAYYLIKNIAKRGQHIETEDIYFENHWNVYSQDQIEARCILTPPVMNRLNRIKKIFKKNNIAFSFYENNILVAIPTSKDMFETTDCFGHITEKTLFSKVILPVYQILKLVDELKVDNNKY